MFKKACLRRCTAAHVSIKNASLPNPCAPCIYTFFEQFEKKFLDEIHGYNVCAVADELY